MRVTQTYALVLSLFLLCLGPACGGKQKHASYAGAQAVQSPSMDFHGGDVREEVGFGADEDFDDVADDDDSDYGEDESEAREAPRRRGPSSSSLAMAPDAARSQPKPVNKTPAQPTTPKAPVTTPKPNGGARPLLIYKANINLAVFEARKSIDQVEHLAKEMGGYLVSRSDFSIVVRVPAGDFDGALERIAKVGDELHRNVSVQDVTAQFRDLQIRLRNLQVVRDRLAALLKKADTVEQALKVERELERVAGNIERIKGKLKLFSELIAFSTITVTFQARPAETISSEINLPFPWLNDLGLGPLLDLN